MKKAERDALAAEYDEWTLDDLIDKRQAFKAEISPIEEKLDVLNDVIKAKLPSAGTFEGDALVYEHEGWIVKMTTQVRSALDKAKLLVAGVTVAQIQAATVTSESVRLDVEKKKEPKA